MNKSKQFYRGICGFLSIVAFLCGMVGHIESPAAVHRVLPRDEARPRGKKHVRCFLWEQNDPSLDVSAIGESDSIVI